MFVLDKLKVVSNSNLYELSLSYSEKGSLNVLRLFESEKWKLLSYVQLFLTPWTI